MTHSRAFAVLKALCAALAIGYSPSVTSSAPGRDTIRTALKKTAVEKFTKGKNDCEAFAQIAEAALKDADNVPEYLEDLKLVLIGEDWLRRKDKRGPYYMGLKTGDSGFRSDLKDSSPQVEHAMAAIYLAKVLPPGGIGAKGSFFELLEAVGRREKPNAADMLLFAYGEDLGDRLAKSNMPQFPTALRRTLCQ